MIDTNTQIAKTEVIWLAIKKEDDPYSEKREKCTKLNGLHLKSSIITYKSCWRFSLFYIWKFAIEW